MTGEKRSERRGVKGQSRGRSPDAGRRLARRGRSGAERRDGAAGQSGAFAAVRIEQVVDVLDEVLQWDHPADAVLSRWFRRHSQAGGRDRAEIAEAVFDVLRHLRRYRQFAESGHGPAARRLAILGLASVCSDTWLGGGLSPQEQAWLQHVRSIALASLPRAVRFSLPDWLEERLGRLDDPESLMVALNQPAPLDLRVNPLKTDRQTLLRAWLDGAQARWSPRATLLSPWGIRMDGRPPVNRWPAFEQGEIEVQDEGSQLLAALVAPKRGELVVDFCAGAGGKTLLLGALMRSTGRLYAFDVSAARLARAKPRFARSGLSNIVPVVIAQGKDTRVRRLRGKIHRVLVDAPCSGLGTLRRNPDLKWRQTPQTLDALRATQIAILREAAALVRPGGRLVYATCSPLPEENEGQVEAFLRDHPEFSVVDARPILAARNIALALDEPWLHLRPDHHGTDAFFAAVLQRAPA